MENSKSTLDDLPWAGTITHLHTVRYGRIAYVCMLQHTQAFVL